MESASGNSNIVPKDFTSSMAGGRSLLPRDCFIPHDFERSELAKHPDVLIDCRPHAVVEFFQFVTQLRLCLTRITSHLLCKMPFRE